MLSNDDMTGCRVGRQPHAIPLPWLQRRAGIDPHGAIRARQFGECASAVAADTQLALGKECGGAIETRGPEQDRPDAWGVGLSCGALGDQSVRAEMDRLVAALQGAVQAEGEVLELHA